MSSQSDINPNELEFKILEESDDLSTFDCSKDDTMGLNEFIHHEALQFQKENLGVTYLFLYKKQVVGFATLQMSEMEIKLTPYILPFRVKIKFYPALQIGRLAVHNDFRSRNIGQNICLWCASLAKQLSEKVGCRMIVVLTEGRPVDFYKKCRFEIALKYDKKERKLMHLQVPRE